MKTGGIVFVALVYIPEYIYGRSVTHTFLAKPLLLLIHSNRPVPNIPAVKIRPITIN